MKFLLDTCLISELVKKEPSTSVIDWLDQCDEQTLFLSVLTLGELQKGISKLSAGRKRDELQAWAEFDLTARFEGRILDLDRETAVAWGRLIGEAEREGIRLPVMDALIAATAAVHGLVVVTRNVKDMERCRARVFNPWDR
ncbi:type II toxin-antitoxin system VapC family toxin [Geobacter grbiciae]|uniref:type II toxin-antitoxin system VapC family toxin n=1 Tax=Geobacter grbiciae TaxID=155042 RepID=UPI001C02DFCC|nr:type II toxin-antitoxin system VapC family toxin [Geobacter grbiciae]